MPTEFNVVIERDPDGLFVASVPALPGCYTQAVSRDELMARIAEAIALHLEDRGEPVDLWSSLRSSGSACRVSRLPRLTGREVMNLGKAVSSRPHQRQPPSAPSR